MFLRMPNGWHIGIYGISLAKRPGLLRLDARELDHPGPLVGFIGDELAEVGR